MSQCLRHCRWCDCRTWRVVTFACIIAASLVSRAGAQQPAATMAPYCDDNTLLVAHVDLSRVDVNAAVSWVKQIMPGQASTTPMLAAGQTAATQWLGAFRQAGGRDLYAAISMSDVGAPGAPTAPLFLVVPVVDGGNANVLRQLIPTTKSARNSFQEVRRIPADGPLVFGSHVTLQRLQQLRAGRNNKKLVKHLGEAFSAVQNAPVQVVFTLTPDLRRVLREMFPALPPPLDKIDGRTLTDGLVWKAVGIELPPHVAVRSIVRATSGDAARRMAEAWKQVLDFVASYPVVRQQVPVIDRIVALLQPTVDGEQLIVAVDQEAVVPLVKQLLVPAAVAAQGSAQRVRRTNQFKQLALAMHNWADTIGKPSASGRRILAFPAAAICARDGKPLLSWRVAILPYLEQKKLYDQFHLDEPWDSPHNKKLIAQMPTLYRDPAVGAVGAVAGKPQPPAGYTTFVVPTGEGLVFGRAVPTTLREIMDGTSNTIMITEVVPGRAVPWTKPADWPVPPVKRDAKSHKITQGDPLDGVRRSDRDWFVVAYCDGSVHVVANTVDPALFYSLLTRSGGEVVRP